MSNLEKFTHLKKSMDLLRAEYKETAATMFGEVSQQLFDQYPTLLSFSWTQYTPYFNDGDSCTFSANTDYLRYEFSDTERSTGEKDEYDDDNEGEEYNAETLRRRKERAPLGLLLYDSYPAGGIAQPLNEHEEIALAVGEFVQQFDEEILQDMFGDHVRVVVKRDGTVDADEYEHD